MNANFVCTCQVCGKAYFDYVSTCSVCGNEKIIVLRPFAVSAKTVKTTERARALTHSVDWKAFSVSVMNLLVANQL